MQYTKLVLKAIWTQIWKPSLLVQNLEFSVCVVIAVGMVRSGGPPLPSPPAPTPFLGKCSWKKTLFFKDSGLWSIPTAYATGTSTICVLSLSSSFLCAWAWLFKRWIALFTRLITIQWRGMRKMNCAIQWIEIYLMDSVIHLLNYWDQVIVWL